MHAARSTRSIARIGISVEGEHLRTWGAAFLYLGIAIVFSWPLARGLARDVPSDLGDSLLNMWILSWDAEQLRHLFTGDFAVLTRWFDANIFHPVPDTLAYSEHLIAQAVQIFPVYLLTRNPILCYNLLFLSTYVLSGLGTYLLVRELTGDRRAALAAGLIFAFVPYRIPQASHLQVLSSQWMPWTLYGFTRYLDTGYRRALAGGAFALVVQSLSCGYYLIFFSPFAAGYVVWELARRGRLTDRRAWTDFVIAAIAMGVAIAPFLLPYARVQESMRLTRRIEEVGLYSADVYAYLTSYTPQRFWGPILRLVAPRAEGELFMGAIPLLLGLVSTGFVLVEAWRAGRASAEPHPVLSRTLGTLTAAALVLVIVALYTLRISIDVGVFSFRVTDIGRVMIQGAVAGALWLIFSPRARARLRACCTAEGFFLLSIVVAWWLSLGPTPLSLGRHLDVPAPYRLFYLLPGVDGVRAPARFAMVMALMLAVAGGYVLARLPRGRAGAFIAAVLVALFLVEAPASEFPVNGRGTTRGHELPEGRVYPPAAAPLLYQTVKALPEPAVLLEMPLGDLNWDVRAVYYSAAHWRPLVNGYSGFFPPHYGALVSALIDPDSDPGAAWQAVVGSGATHVMVHEDAYRDAETDQIRRWLASRGAREVARDGGDVLYDVRPANP